MHRTKQFGKDSDQCFAISITVHVPFLIIGFIIRENQIANSKSIKFIGKFKVVKINCRNCSLMWFQTLRTSWMNINKKSKEKKLKRHCKKVFHYTICLDHSEVTHMMFKRMILASFEKGPFSNCRPHFPFRGCIDIVPNTY